jgi:ribonuclease HII
VRLTRDHLPKLYARYPIIVGVDEVGRGCLAGCVTAAAMCWRVAGNDNPNPLPDSKQLTANQRQQVVDAIITAGHPHHLASATTEEIDRLNILQASLLAMQRAVVALLGHGLCADKIAVVVDGQQVPILPAPYHQIPLFSLIGGDALVPQIAAASTLAKVARDAEMVGLAALHPPYGWDRNKGYGTRAHLQALQTHGPTVYHRQSFAPVRQAIPPHSL